MKQIARSLLFPPKIGRSLSTTKAPKEDKLTLFVSCIPGLEPILSNELKALKIRNSPTNGGVNIRSASVNSITKCHLFVGSASHVLLRCGKAFNVRGFPELSRKVERMPWSSFLQEDAVLDIRVTCEKSKIYHTGAVAERVESGINKAFGRTSPSDGPIVPIHVRVNRDVVQISIDTSTTPLHQRGYRLETGKAPLREDIAYSMLYAAGWNKNYDALLDPLCGSGTIAIEAAAMKMELPPGRLRDKPLQGTALFNNCRWDELLHQALENSTNVPYSCKAHPLVVAGDRDEGVVKACLANATRAGVQDVIHICSRSVSDHDWFMTPAAAPESLLIATNPPYGNRIAASRNKSERRMNQMLPLYQTLSKKISTLMPLHNVGTVILTNKIELVRRMGLPDTKALLSTQHGGIGVVAVGANLKYALVTESSFPLSQNPSTNEVELHTETSLSDRKLQGGDENHAFVV